MEANGIQENPQGRSNYEHNHEEPKDFFRGDCPACEAIE
jgi:hypothetical protein